MGAEELRAYLFEEAAGERHCLVKTSTAMLKTQEDLPFGVLTSIEVRIDSTPSVTPPLREPCSGTRLADGEIEACKCNRIVPSDLVTQPGVVVRVVDILRRAGHGVANVPESRLRYSR